VPPVRPQFQSQAPRLPVPRALFRAGYALCAQKDIRRTTEGPEPHANRPSTFSWTDIAEESAQCLSGKDAPQLFSRGAVSCTAHAMPQVAQQHQAIMRECGRDRLFASSGVPQINSYKFYFNGVRVALFGVENAMIDSLHYFTDFSKNASKIAALGLSAWRNIPLGQGGGGGQGMVGTRDCGRVSSCIELSRECTNCRLGIAPALRRDPTGTNRRGSSSILAKGRCSPTRSKRRPIGALSRESKSHEP
jgi:hypothetical protein